MNGSFTTTKLNPGDVDFVNFVSAEVLDHLAPVEQQEMYELLTHKHGSPCHAFLVPVFPPDSADAHIMELHQEFWAKWFGHQRDGTPKGIVRLRLGKP